MAGVNDRQVKLSRGRFLGGCSGCNGTLCIRGCKQDYDDWTMEGWSGDEFFNAMRKVLEFPTGVARWKYNLTIWGDLGRDLSQQAMVQRRCKESRLLRAFTHRAP